MDAELLRGLVDELPRAEELAERLCASGPKAAHVSCSETHEIKDFILAAASVLRALSVAQGQGFEFVGWEIQCTDESWRRYRGKGEPPAHMTHRRRIYAAAPAQPDGVK